MAQDRALTIRVECYAGSRGEETPRRFFVGDRAIAVAEILDRWLAPEHRYFKIRGDDGDVYIIRHDADAGVWELTMYSRDSGLPPPPRLRRARRSSKSEGGGTRNSEGRDS